MDANQFGFHQKLGQIDALIQFTSNILKVFDDEYCVLRIFIDFSKAFNRKLKSLKILQRIGLKTTYQTENGTKLSKSL